jgi:hypothetical protein
MVTNHNTVQEIMGKRPLLHQQEKIAVPLTDLQAALNETDRAAQVEAFIRIASLLPKPAPHLITVSLRDLEQLAESMNTNRDRQAVYELIGTPPVPDLLSILDEAIESVAFLCDERDKCSNIDRVKFRIRAALGGTS